MEKIKNINELKLGQSFVKIHDNKIEFYEFLLLNPHNSEFVICFDKKQNIIQLHFSEIEDCSYINYTKKDILLLKHKFLLNALCENNKILEQYNNEINDDDECIGITGFK